LECARVVPVVSAVEMTIDDDDEVVQCTKHSADVIRRIR